MTTSFQQQFFQDVEFARKHDDWWDERIGIAFTGCSIERIPERSVRDKQGYDRIVRHGSSEYKLELKTRKREGTKIRDVLLEVHHPLVRRYNYKGWLYTSQADLIGFGYPNVKNGEWVIYDFNHLRSIALELIDQNRLEYVQIPEHGVSTKCAVMPLEYLRGVKQW